MFGTKVTAGYDGIRKGGISLGLGRNWQKRPGFKEPSLSCDWWHTFKRRDQSMTIEPADD